MTKRHKVFVSYHHTNDQNYRKQFEELFVDIHDIIVPKSVQIGEIDPHLPAERIRQIIRDEYLRDTTVTVVLIGIETWKRKHIDWEIGGSIRETKYNTRSGLLGIFLPSHSDFGRNGYNKHIIPPRLSDNADCGFAKLYDWSEKPYNIQNWIHDAFKRRGQINPDNSYSSYKNNRSGERWY